MVDSPTLVLEKERWALGFERIAGVDEAGRGAWAGPVTAAAVILPRDETIQERLFGVRDSKQMSPRQRELWADIVRREALAWGVGHASNVEVDALGIVAATKSAMRRALAQLVPAADYLLIDAVKLDDQPLPWFALNKGDAISLSIAAASVLAKTARDRLMGAYGGDGFEAYQFAAHKGYGTAAHRAALEAHGASVLHRFSYQPIRALKRR